MQLKDLVITIEPIILQAGEIILSWYQRQGTAQRKSDNSLVTQADKESEGYIRSQISVLFPEHTVLGEEMGADNVEREYCWVIDPLDGTTNFVHKVPYFCISIALTKKGLPIFGMIYQPLTKELWYAGKNEGAFLNGKQIQVSEKDLIDGFLLVGVPYKKGASYYDVIDHLSVISPRSYAFRHLGAIALDLAFVASGRADAVFFEDLSWWDVAAGVVLISEAGGRISNFQGKAVEQGYKTCVAGNKGIHGQLLEILQKRES